MKRFVVAVTVWAMGLAWVLTSVVLPAGSASADVVSTPGGFTSLAPFRLLDTRNGTGDPQGAAAVPALGTVQLQVTGRGNVPSGVSAVALNVTVTQPTGAGYVTVYGDGSARPVASNLNFGPGQTVPNTVIAPVGAGGVVDLYNGSNGTIHLIADVSGYYLSGTPSAAGAFGSLAPSRLMDTRIGVPQGVVPALGTVHLQVTGAGGVPASGVSAVALNVTVTQPAGAGYVTVYGEGSSRPVASNLNFGPGETVPNMVIAPVGAGGVVDLYNGSNGTIHLIADVSGYTLSGAPDVAGAFGSLAPSRLMDTRIGVPQGVVPALGTVHLQVTGAGGVPASGVSSVALNVTVTQPAGSGFVTVYGEGSGLPVASNLNFVAGETVPNMVIAPVGTGGVVDLYNGSSGTIHLIADVSGYTRDRAPVQTWSSPTTVAPGGRTRTLSCPSPTSCTAVDGSGNAITYDGSTWASPQIIDAHHDLVGLSCPTTGFCVAIDASGYALSDVAGTWSAPVAVSVAPSSAGLSNVSCASSTFCMATNGTFGTAYRFNGTSWSGPTTVMSDAATSGLSCPTSTFCMMGDVTGRVTTYNGSTWSVPAMIDSGQGLGSMSCPSASFCAVTDNANNVLTWPGTTWSAPVGLGFSAAVSCASATLCLAVSADSGDQSRYDGVSWSSVTPAPDGVMSMVSCVSTVCVAVAPAPRDVINSNSATFNSTAATWSSPVVVEAIRTLVDASCASSTFCAGVDAAGTAYTYDGTNWSAGVTIDSVAVPTSISCTAGPFCVVVDDGGGAVIFSGTTWLSRVSVGSSISTVSCASSTFCVATMGKTVSTWDGSTWSGATATGAPGIIYSVSCTGTQICTVVDGSGYTLDDTPTGWTAPQQLTAPDGSLSSVSCTNTGFCATFGADSGGNVSFVRNSGTWLQIPVPASLSLGTGNAGHYLSCVATNYCLATAQPAPMPSPPHSVIASYDGLQWAMIQTFADPSWARPMSPQTVSCVPDQTCLINLAEEGNAIVAWGRRT